MRENGKNFSLPFCGCKQRQLKGAALSNVVSLNRLKKKKDETINIHDLLTVVNRIIHNQYLSAA